MTKIIIIEKNGTIKEKNVKNISCENAYKYCSLKNDNSFSNIHSYQTNGMTYDIYAKDSGRANNENKYELPPPIDNTLYFGTICVLKHNNDDYCDITVDEWTKVYEKMFGGFEDIGDEDSVMSEDSEHPDEDYTKNGYLKDGFVVDDEDEDEDDISEYEEEYDNVKMIDVEKVNSKIISLLTKHNIDLKGMNFDINNFIDSDSDEE